MQVVHTQWYTEQQCITGIKILLLKSKIKCNSFLVLKLSGTLKMPMAPPDNFRSDVSNILQFRAEILIRISTLALYLGYKSLY